MAGWRATSCLVILVCSLLPLASGIDEVVPAAGTNWQAVQKGFITHLMKGVSSLVSSMALSSTTWPRDNWDVLGAYATWNPESWRWDQYHKFVDSSAYLMWLQSSYPQLVKLEVIGRSVQGREIHAVHITAPQTSNQTYKPIFKWLGGMHGNEVSSIEMMMRLAFYLASEYGYQSRVTSLLQSVRVQIVPCLNPDGRENNSRINHADMDLNRNFPLDAFNLSMVPFMPDESEPLKEWHTHGQGPPEPETVAAMRWFEQDAPVFLSANVHGGALGVVYPLDVCDPKATKSPCPTKDEPLPRFLALVYALNHPELRFLTDGPFKNGTVNGADWYPIVGSLADWVYHSQKGMHLTLELHEAYQEPAGVLPQMWEDNQLSLLRLTEMVNLGVMLWVVDNSTSAFLEASVEVLAPAGVSNATAFKDHNRQPAYFKMITPGIEYCLRVQPQHHGPQKGPAYAPVLVAAKLPLSREQLWEGQEVDGLRLEKVLKVVPGKASPVVKLGGATAAACITQNTTSTILNSG